MSGAKQNRIAPGQAPPRVDFGKRFARFLCLIFALIGLVPLSGGLLLRSAPVKMWAANETSRLLRVHLGLSATYRVELSLIPLRLEILELAVADTLRPQPAIRAELIAISPRFFSLLAGRIDVGDIELENSSVRLQIENGKVKNVALRVPENEGASPELTRAPFRTLAVTSAHLDLSIDQQHVEVEGIDLDVIADKELTFDMALRALGARISTQRALPPSATREAPSSADGRNASAKDATKTGAQDDPKGEPDEPKVEPEAASFAYSEDRLCALELRAELSPSKVSVRRLSLMGALDSDEARETWAKCGGPPDRQVALRLSQFEVDLAQHGVRSIQGNIMTKLPLFAVERFKPGLAGTGWVGFSGSIAYDTGARLPEVSGKVSGAGMSIAGYKISDQLAAEVLINKEVVFVPNMTARWGNGEARISDLEIEPFAPNIPLSISHISTSGVDFPGVMREILVTNHSWVDWNFGQTEIDDVRGTIAPFYIDGAVDGHTKDFVVWDRGFDDPARKKMLAIGKADVKGRFRAHKKALEFYSCDLRFGTSHVPVDLVSIGFHPQELIVRTQPEGGEIELADLSPIADLELSGKTNLYADMAGPMTHPILKGTMAVDDLTLGGFVAGDVKQADVHFEPLFVEFTELSGEKGGMDYSLPRARLSFDGPATVEFQTAVKSRHFSLAEFLDVFHFDDDPRFEGLAGAGAVDGNVRYVLGGPEDACGEGRLLVDASFDLKSASFLDEEYSGGQGQFSLDWFDIEAGLRGLSLYVPTATLRKGSGSVFGSLTIRPGGKLTGDLVGTQIPLSRIDALGKELSQFDGFVTGSGQLGGTVDALEVDAQLAVSELKLASASLAPSRLSVHMERFAPPEDPKAPLSGCGRRIPQPYIPEPGQEEGKLVVSGQLFGSQILIDELSVTQKDSPTVAGGVKFKQLDLAQVEGMLLPPGRKKTISQGKLSGQLTLDELRVGDPFASRGQLEVTQADLKTGGVKIRLEKSPFFVRLVDRTLRSEGLVLAAQAPGGQTGIIDANFSIDSVQKLDAQLKLRPTSLAVLAAITPTIERAEGELSAEVAIDGALRSPKLHGAVDIKDGLVEVRGIDEPLDELSLHAELDQKGIHLKSGHGKFGGGDLSFKGDLPITDGQLGELELGIYARRVHYKPEKEVQVTFDADLKLLALRSNESDEEEEEKLPRLSGTVDILSASYKKPMSITADISTLTTRGEKTNITGYDVNKDNIELDLLIRSSRPLNVENDLVVATLRLDPSGLRVTGTDQRFGAVGTVEVQNGGHIFLRRNEFELKSGLVRFNDPTRLRPEVDVSAVTEYRRYNKLGGGPNQTNTSDASSTTVGSGNWRIVMHAYGPPDNLKVDLTSDPPLGQDDIFLLLTVGLTRTELDQSRNSGVGSSVALEALGTLSGAESAVTDVVPVDEFRFGSTFSSRSGRTEPTVTIGKRLSDRIRASVTTSLSETSEVRSNVEYRATQNLSVEGSYDNARNVASAAGGNLGGDVRWRVEFR